MKAKIICVFTMFSVITTAQIYTPGSNGQIQGSSGNQNVGIGIPNPQGKLHVKTSSEVGIVIDVNQLAGGAGPALGEPGENNTSTPSSIYPLEIFYTDANLQPSINNELRARWHANGRLDLGGDFTGFPVVFNSRLNVLHSMGVYTNPNRYTYLHQNSIRWYSGNNNPFQIGFGNAGNTTQTNLFTLTPYGLAGLGTQTPATVLHLKDNTPSAEINQEGSPTEKINGLLIENNGWRNHDYALQINSGLGKVFTVGNAGTVHIGNTLNRSIPDSEYKLWVEGGIRTEKVKVDIASVNGWADYVFADDYVLMPLVEVEAYIKQNKHLPGVPSAEEVVENGVELAEMNKILLAKIEELHLRLIELEKQVEKQ